MEQIWFKDTKNLFNDKNFMKIFPSSDMTFVEQLNTLLRFSVYFTLIILVIKKDVNILFLPIFIGLLTYIIYKVNRDNFKNDKEVLENMGMTRDSITNKICVKPTKDNPFMNVLMSDYSDRPNRPSGCLYKGKIKQEIKKNFDTNLYRDVDDIFHNKASDRQFYTTPSTTIPNDSIKYAEWLYKRGPTCKEETNTCYNNIYRTLV